MASTYVDKVLFEMARLSGHTLSDQERLIIRTRVASALVAKERYRQRMSSDAFTWKKPLRVKR